MNRLILASLATAFLTLAWPAAGERYVRFDLREAVASDPMMARFDPETRRFVGTESQFRDLESVSRAIASLDAEIDRESTRQQAEVALALEAGKTPGESGFWDRLGDLAARVDRLRRQRAALEKVLAKGAATTDSSILGPVALITGNLVRKASFPSDTLVLNLLPRHPPGPLPDWEINPLRLFLWNPNPGFLDAYLASEISLGSLFPGVPEPILYSAPKP